MIVKICDKGARATRLVNYSFSPGHGNEHTNPHTVGGTVHYPENDRATIRAIITDLHLHQDMWPDVAVPGGHVWHHSLSVGADEGILPESKWAAIAEDYMREMGFDSPTKGGVQWTAIHHGQSVKENDHIHIVMSGIRADGTKLNDWKSKEKSQQVAAKLEVKHGLKVLQSRGATLGAGSVPYTGGEAGKARDSGLPIERVDIERRVRAALSASSDEAEFVRRVRADGLVVRPFPDKGAVTGWSIGVPTDGKPIFFTGGKVARDLTLPKIREVLGKGAGNADAEWRGGADGQPVLVGGREQQKVAVAPDLVAKVEGELFSLGQKLQNATPEQFAELSGELSGVLAATSVAVEGAAHGELARASREVGAWSQTRRLTHSGARNQRPAGRGLALLMLQSLDPQGPIGQAIMVRQLTEAVLALWRLHRASRSVAVGSGRFGMSSPDAVDQATEHGVTMTVTAAAIGVSSWAERHRKRVAEGRPKSVLDFRSPSEFGERDPMPKGLEGVISSEEWRGMDDAQRKMVDPDRVGRWPTDYYVNHDGTGSPGASLRSTVDQDSRIRVLSATANEAVPNVGDMSRGRAAEYLRGLEEKLGPGTTGEAYLKAGMVHRQVMLDENMNEHYTLVFPGAQGAVGAAKLPDPTPVRSSPVPQPTLSVSNQTVLSDPSTWKSADKLVTPAQAYTLKDWGFKQEEIDKLRKGTASSVITAINDFGQSDPTKVDRAYEKAVAAMIQTPPVVKSVSTVDPTLHPLDGSVLPPAPVWPDPGHSR